MPNSPGFLFSFLAVLSVGHIAVPLSPMLTSREVEIIAKDSGANWAISPPDDAARTHVSGSPNVKVVEVESYPESKQSLVSLTTTEMEPQEPAYIVYTSGTTSLPKGVIHMHGSVLGRKPMQEGWHQMQESDRVFHAGELNWTYTMGVGIMDPWSVGATSILCGEKKAPEAWPQLIKASKTTIFATVPSLYRRILKYGEDLHSCFSSIRHFLSAGESLSPKLFARFQEKTGKVIYESLGMSECSTYISHCPRFSVVPGSIGRIQPGRQVEILSLDNLPKRAPIGGTGVLAIHRNELGLMSGYTDGNNQKFYGDWFITGDLVKIDKEGYLWFEGRQSDLLNAFGYRVSPLEIESLLGQFEEIFESAVAEIQLNKEVSVIAAFVVCDGEKFSLEEILKKLEVSLASYKIPKAWFKVEELPKTATGKLLRQKLQEPTFTKEQIPH